MKFLGVAINNKSSVNEHVSNIICGCEPILHALRTLRAAHGMRDTVLHVIYESVVIAKLTYAASAWWD